MFSLTILKSDDSVYWVEHFKTRAELDRWLATEKTRPYWVASYKSQIQDITPQVDPVEQARQTAEKLKRNDASARLTQVDFDKIKTVDDLKAVIKDLIDKG